MSKARLIDLLAALPLIALYALAIPQLAFQMYGEVVAEPIPALRISIADKGTTVIFLGLQLVLFLVRRLPVAKLSGWWPRLVTLIAADGALVLTVLPRARVPNLLAIGSSLLLIGGTVGAIIVLFFLGRSFSIMPQARGLVVSGPYRFVRHPLYLMEQIALAGIMLQYRQPWSFGIFALAVSLQFVRMRYEEKILSEVYSDYGSYAKRTSRLIPGVY